MGRMTLISGDERRRRWSDDDRARILSEIEAPGAVVAEVARRTACASATGFTPVVIEASPVASASQPSVGPSDVIVVEVNDARVRIGAGAPSALITATLKAVLIALTVDMAHFRGRRGGSFLGLVCRPRPRWLDANPGSWGDFWSRRRGSVAATP